MNPKIKIRKAEKRDEEQLVELTNQFWEVHKGIDPIIVPAKKQTKTEIIKELHKTLKKKNTFLFVYEEDGKVIGSIEFFIQKNDPFFKVKKYGFLDSAVTLKEHRKKGVAKTLTNFAMNFLKKKGIKYIRSKVYYSNTDAIKAWEKMGFQFQSINLLKEIK